MIFKRSISASACGLALAASLSVAGPAAAAEPAYGGGASGQGIVDVAGRPGAARRLDLSIGRSVVIELTRDAKEIFVANPAVANAVVRSTRKLFLLGIANGSTSVFVMDAEGRQIASLEVTVGRDLAVLRQTLRATIASGRIEVRAAGDSILLTGTVSSAGDAQQAMDIAKAFVGQAGGGGAAGDSGSVINALTIAGRDQVMLRVSVVEVARSVVKQLGISTSGSWSAVNLAAAAVSGGFLGAVSGSLGPSGANITGGVRSGNSDVGGTLQALERAGLSRVLAEPTLVAVSGESATFTAGGEIPVASSVVCSGTAGGVGSGCVPSYTYKTYGVALNFTPVVLSEGRISMRVGTEVSEIDPDNGASLQLNVTAPAFRVRKTATTVELPSGATMMTAGLISQQSMQTIRGVPGLINLPVIGALFRSRDYQRKETELMIMVTPFIAKPMEAAQAKRPDDGFVEAHDAETVLLGRLNKLYGVAGPGAPRARGSAGRFGFITD